jgi:hypothetical protein
MTDNIDVRNVIQTNYLQGADWIFSGYFEDDTYSNTTKMQGEITFLLCIKIEL